MLICGDCLYLNCHNQPRGRPEHQGECRMCTRTLYCYDIPRRKLRWRAPPASAQPKES